MNCGQTETNINENNSVIIRKPTLLLCGEFCRLDKEKKQTQHYGSDDLGLTWAGVESQVGDLSIGPLQLRQNHSTNGPVLLARPLGLGPAPAPQINGAMHVVLGG